MRAERRTTPNTLLKAARLRRAWTQRQVADMIDAPHAYIVNRWENGACFPSLRYQQRLCELFERSPQELGLLRSQSPSRHHSALPRRTPTRCEWGEAPDLQQIYGRGQERHLLERWIVQDRCRVIVISGIGGVGKTLLAGTIAHQVQEHFSVLYWSSLINTPLPTHFLESCLKCIDPEFQAASPHDDLLLALLTYLRQQRILLVLDNFESLLQPGRYVGPYRERYEDYGRLLRILGEKEHQSCLLITSREIAPEVARLEGEDAPVRCLHLEGLPTSEGKHLLAEKRLCGSPELEQALISFYSGNPLALQLVAHFIKDFYGGDIALYLEENQGVFCDVREILEQQFVRLDALEQALMYWLAIRREPVSLKDVQEDVLPRQQITKLAEAVRSLHRRSLLEESARRFFLQNVVLEFLTERLVEVAYRELESGRWAVLRSHALIQAGTRDYVRNAQFRLILDPLAEKLIASLGRDETRTILMRMLTTLQQESGGRQASELPSGYAAGNLLNLLVHLRYDLRGLDFSHLRIEQAYLLGVALQESSFANAHIDRSVFSEAFGPVRSLAWQRQHDVLAAGTTTGTISLWDIAKNKLFLARHGHTGWVSALSFHPDGTQLATGGGDHAVRVWEIPSGRCLLTYQGYADSILALSFSPDGAYLASAGVGKDVHLLDARSGELLRVYKGHSSWVEDLAWSPDSGTLTSGGLDGTIQVWDASSGEHVTTLTPSQDSAIWSLAFHPSGTLLAGGGGLGKVFLWDAKHWHELAALEGHKDRVWSLAFHKEGHLLASGSEDDTIRLWDMQTLRTQKILQGHTFAVRSVAFNASGTLLGSGSDDKMVRVWEVPRGECRQVLQGYLQAVHAVAFSPDGSLLATGNEDNTIQLWDMQRERWLSPLQGHTYRVGALRFSPDGRFLVSSAEDCTARIWDLASGSCLEVFPDNGGLTGSLALSHDGVYLASKNDPHTTSIWNLRTRTCTYLPICAGVAFHPHSAILAVGNALWDVREEQWILDFQDAAGKLGDVAFSPDGKLLACCGGDGSVHVFDLEKREKRYELHGHSSRSWSLAFHPAGHLLASSSNDRTIRLWDLATGNCLRILHGHEGCVETLAFHPAGHLLASGSVDGTCMFWDVASGQPTKTLRSKRLYENLDIRGVTGLTPAQKETLRALGARGELP